MKHNLFCYFFSLNIFKVFTLLTPNSSLTFDSPVEDEIFKLELVDFSKTIYIYIYIFTFQKKDKNRYEMYSLVGVKLKRQIKSFPNKHIFQKLNLTLIKISQKYQLK